MKLPQGYNTNSSKNGKSNSPAAEFVKLEAENQEIEKTLHSCQVKISELGLRNSEVENSDAADLEEQLSDLEEKLKGHFECEEQSVLHIFRQWEKAELILPLEEVIEEKEQIYKELAVVREEVGRLIAKQLGLKPNYDLKRLSSRIHSLSRLIKSHNEKEGAIFAEAKRIVTKANP